MRCRSASRRSARGCASSESPKASDEAAPSPMARAPHFLRPLLNAAPAGLCLRNQRTGQMLATTLLPALDSASRKTGLLKHTSLADGEAMVIAPSNAVHTWFMRFDLDLVFVRRD